MLPGALSSLITQSQFSDIYFLLKQIVVFADLEDVSETGQILYSMPQCFQRSPILICKGKSARALSCLTTYLYLQNNCEC